MMGWILYSKSESDLKERDKGVNRLLAESINSQIDLKIIDAHQVDIVVCQKHDDFIFVDGKSEALPDFVLNRMGAKTTYYALAVIRYLESLGVPCFSSSLSIERAKDKLYSQQLLSKRGYPIPKTLLMNNSMKVSFIEEQIGFPLILKTLCGIAGRGVFLIRTKKDFEDYKRLINNIDNKYSYIIQEYIKSSFGKDIRTFIIGNKVVGCIQRIAREGEFRSGCIINGGEVKKMDITPEIETIALNVAREFGLDIAAVDFLIDNNDYKISEVNSSPGFNLLEETCQVNIPQEIFSYIKSKIRTE